LQIRSILAAQLGLEPSEIRPEANILDDLGADSLDVVEMVMSLEQAFDIEMPDEEVESMRTLGNVSESEMYRTFNMGVGMVIVCSTSDAEAIASHLGSEGETVYEIGNVVTGNREVLI